MKLIIKIMKAIWPLKRNQAKAETEYTDLAPIDEITNGAEYLNALDWAFNNDRIKNIALAGPYGSGKSSIIETYLKQHPILKSRSLRISMATFTVTENKSEKESEQKVDIEQIEIELGILKQLFYKVDYKKIPQSRYRKLHKIGWKHIWGYLVGFAVILSLLMCIFSPEVMNSITDKITLAGASINLPDRTALLLFSVLILGILAIVSIMYRSILSHFKVKEINLPIDATVKSEVDSIETVFNKNMDEIVYFFEETKYRYVFFEDLDRLEDSSIFVHLRELNTLLNNYDVIKEPIIFVYAVKDDIFSATDRTKFFDFIVPVIPIINSTNSGESLLDNLNKSKGMDITHEISQSFVLDVSPFIADMRVLQNIYNEFVVYKKTLRTDQDLKLLDEPMMALIIFKNLYPRDFADIQMEQGIIKKAFGDKISYVTQQLATWQTEIDKEADVLFRVKADAMRNKKELKVAMLGALVDWRGILSDIGRDYSRTYSANAIMDDGFDLSVFCDYKQCTIWYNPWNGREDDLRKENLQTTFFPYYERWKYLHDAEQRGISEIQQGISTLKQNMHNISGWALVKLMEKFSAEEVLSTDVMGNKLLVFLLRRGYIDEKYANYINYFKGNSITKGDMNFILAVKNMEPQPFNYSLTKTSMVVQKLQVYEFEQKAIYNFELLEFLLSSDNTDRLNTFINQLADEDAQSWKFIDDFVDFTEHQSCFINLLASAWHNMWGYIVENEVLTYERKIKYLRLVLSNVDSKVISKMDELSEMSDFITQNEDILQQLAPVESGKVTGTIEALKVVFSKVSIENVPTEVIDYIFDNSYYELNPTMLLHVVEHKNRELVPDFETKNYTTIIQLNYMPLIEYVRANLFEYLEKLFLVREQSCDDKEEIVDLLERCIDNSMICKQIIEHEQFCLEDITYCCSGLIAKKKSNVKTIWDCLLKKQKILTTWENLNNYWLTFEFSDELLDFIEANTEALLSADSSCIKDNFIYGFINSEIADGVFEILLPHIRMENFNIDLTSISENRISIMIACRYFVFTATRYEEVATSFPKQNVEFILQNQSDFLEVLDNIEMKSALLENLLFSERIEKETVKILFDRYGSKYMTERIAMNLQAFGLNINLEIFNAAWECLNELGKQKLLHEYLHLLNTDDIYSCFTKLEKWYSDFLDRSKQHIVELPDTPQNQRLAERLKEIDYITSYQLKEKKEYDPSTGIEKNQSVISYRVKAIK